MAFLLPLSYPVLNQLLCSRQDFREAVVVPGTDCPYPVHPIYCTLFPVMPDPIRHPPCRRTPHAIDYDRLLDIVPHQIQWQTSPMNALEVTNKKMRLPLFRPAGRERGLGGVSGGETVENSPWMPDLVGHDGWGGCLVKSGMTGGVDARSSRA